MNRRRVLYADDDFLNGKLLEILLRRAGVACDVAADGWNAVRMFGGGRYDAVVLDAYLPGLSGRDVARRIREMNRSVPLIGVTSDAETAASLACAGFDRIFLKPLRRGGCLEYLLSHL